MGRTSAAPQWLRIQSLDPTIERDTDIESRKPFGARTTEVGDLIVNDYR
ncbi:MAG: hypothetical protein H6837_12625 [Planctomycetes bacterium]|nr:hypothetical protein [Planctomycetota bacterium]